jgi:ABC-type phosphate transport system permease subunit
MLFIYIYILSTAASVLVSFLSAVPSVCFAALLLSLFVLRAQEICLRGRRCMFGVRGNLVDAAPC